MADTVIKKSNAAEKELERRMLADANERDRKAEEQDQKKKNDAKLREVDRLRQLDMQVQSKKN